MLRGLYSATAGLNDSVRLQEILAENLAHLSTPGYRARGAQFETLLNNPSVPEISIRRGQIYTDFQPGPIRETGHALHLAIEGNGFFVLQGPQGPIYTRNGSFHRRADGQIVSDGGYPVLGTGGPIQLPPDALQITIGSDGTISAGGVPVDQIRLTYFDDPQQLRPVGPTLFAASPPSREVPATATVIQGALEGSNVNPAKSIVDMIYGARFYEAMQRSIKTLSDAIHLNTRPE